MLKIGVLLGDDIGLGQPPRTTTQQSLGELVSAFLRMLTRPKRFRGSAVVNQLEQVAYRGVPIVVLISFLVGGIIAQQGIFQLRRFGAGLFVVDLVGILILRELGVLLTAIMLAGRSGSLFAPG